MSKIKKINISNFRIFEGEQEFNFGNDIGITNLIAIYAPNGYGKTSFFDAIEWSFSGKIERFENRLINKSIKDEKKDTILLTNLVSYGKGLKGKVNITTDNEASFIEKTVKKHKKPGTKFYNDYLKGNFSSGSITEGLNEIPKTNILSQDQIDAFLRHKTPEQKFEDLKQFWPESEDATNKLRQVSELHKVVLKNIANAESELKNNTKKLEDITKDNKNIELINKRLNKISEYKAYNFNISLEKIDDNITQEKYDIIYDENLRNIKGISLKIDEAEAEKIELERLRNTLANYISANRILKVSIDESAKLQIRKSNFLNLKKSTEIKKSISENISVIEQRINKYKYIESHIVDYSSDIKEIGDLKNENKSLLIENNKILDHIQTKSKSLLNFTEYKKQCNITRLDKENNQAIIDEKYSDFTKINKSLSEIEIEIVDLKPTMTKKELEIEGLQKNIREFNKIIEDEIYPITILSENQIYNELSKNLIKNTELVLELNSEISLRQKELDQSGSLNENLDKLILFGEDYITTTNSSDCPLCKTSFETFEDLLQKVKLDKKETFKIDEQQNRILKLTEEISKIKKVKLETIEKLKSIVSLKIEEVYEKVELAQEDKNKISNQIRDKNNAKNELSLKLRKCIDFFDGTLKNEMDISEVNIVSLKDKINKEILNLKTRDSRLNNIIKSIEKTILSKESKLLANQSKFNKSKNRIEAVLNKEIFQMMQKTIEELSLNLPQLETSAIKEKLKNEAKELTEKSASLSSVAKEIESLNKSLDDDSIQIDETNIEGKIYETKDITKRSKEDIDDYKGKFEKIVGGNEIREDAINAQLSLNQKTLEDLLILKEHLNTLSIDLELIKDNITRNELEKVINSLKSHLPRLQNASKKIGAAKKDCMDFVQSGINNYFNKEVINKVYSRIEPHPKLTKIEFNTDFNDRGEPRLLIKTGTENDEEEGVNPVLFLSAGQVNVLSLSIFLAKAFEYGNKTIETIFMDDPIQNLSDINVLSFIDLLRTLISTHDKQIIISTHDEKFFRLLQNKLPEEYCNTKYFEFESEGKLKVTKT